MLTETMFCGGTSILPLTFNTDEMERRSPISLLMPALAICFSLRLTMEGVPDFSSSFTSGAELHAFNSKAKLNKINEFFILFR